MSADIHDVDILEPKDGATYASRTVSFPETTDSKVTSHWSFTSSFSVKELVSALARARQNFKPVYKTKRNEFKDYDYAGMDDLIDATSQALAEQGIVVVQSPDTNGTNVTVTTTIYHSSGEYFRSVISGPARDAKGAFNIQTVGIGITYLCRYAYRALLNISIKDEDDDGARLVADEVKENKSTPLEINVPSVNHEPAKPANAPRPGESGKQTEKKSSLDSFLDAPFEATDDDLPESFFSDTVVSVSSKKPDRVTRKKFADHLRSYGVDAEALKRAILKLVKASDIMDLTMDQWKEAFAFLDDAKSKGKLNQIIKES